MNPSVDQYLLEGCGRCELYQTPQCKVHSWPKELQILREIALDSGLKEEFKWSQPCYTHKGKNVLIVTAFKHYASMAFFKGALLQDPENILVAPGENSQSSRQVKCTDPQQIVAIRPTLQAYIQEAIEVENLGLKIEVNKKPEVLPEELSVHLQNNPDLKAAWDGLTPGRRRGYILHFSQAKQSKTREARIQKWIPKILIGEGMQDAWKKK